MGWTTMNFNGTRTEFVNSEFNREPAHGTVIKSAVVGTVIYAAYKLGEKHGQRAGKVTALIILTSKQKGYYNFGYKDMSESCAPFERKCPKSIIDLLSPIEELYEEGSSSREWATEWRRDCLAHATTPKAQPIRPGMKIKLKEPIKFNNGMVEDTFINVKTNVWELEKTGILTKFRPSRFEHVVLAS